MASGERDKANNLFTALGHPLRRRVLRKMIQKDGELSPRELAVGLAEPLSAVSYHVRVLAECRAVKLMRTGKVRGATEHFYRPTVKAKWARSALATTRDPAKKNRPRGEEKG
ncbi:MAG TPA: helix-turn-helix domain-containing protein [Solirubrobacterales bacterium]|jgi:DNA-binding transcriptional ArsR family regulator|nr:helix-turn-helix domain-containing protein [Solirubrobacterales bacterium]